MATVKKASPAIKKVAPKTTSKSPVAKKEAPKGVVLAEKVKKAPAKKVKSTSTLNGDQFLSENAVLLTKDGLAKLKEELNSLKTTRRQQVAERLKEAISYGDLSENSEYQEAKEEQALVEGRILELEQQVKNAKVIEEGEVTEKVKIGSKVTVKNLTAKTESTYTIVGSTEADITAGRISNESPVGKALLGKEKGVKVKVEVPAGTFEYEVVKIS